MDNPKFWILNTRWKSKFCVRPIGVLHSKEVELNGIPFYSYQVELVPREAIGWGRTLKNKKGSMCIFWKIWKYCVGTWKIWKYCVGTLRMYLLILCLGLGRVDYFLL